MADTYDRWFLMDSNGFTPLDYYRDTGRCPFPSDQYGFGSYRNTLFHLLNHAVRTRTIDLVQLLLRKYAADPNTTDMNCYNGRALFVTVFERLNGTRDLSWGHRSSDDVLDLHKCHVIFREFIDRGASYKDLKKCFPFAYDSGNDEQRATMAAMAQCVEKRIAEQI
jgi:hypothetical protein